MANRMPKLIAFDLDYTLWDLWIDTLSGPLKRDGDKTNLVLDIDNNEIRFYKDVPQILHRLKGEGVFVAACSRTSASSLARQALSLLLVPAKDGDKSGTPVAAEKLFDQMEIYPGSKKTHFRELHEATGIPYEEMLFFDDERRNKEVGSLGKRPVTCLFASGTGSGFVRKGSPFVWFRMELVPAHLKKGLKNGGGVTQSELQRNWRPGFAGRCRSEDGDGEVEKERWWWIGGTELRRDLLKTISASPSFFPADMLQSKPGSSLFLGIELATDQLRATLVDDNLELMGVECVDFDTEVPEYQTQGGIFTTPGDAYTTPVDMWVKALDLLLEKLHRNHDLARIRAIGGSAQHALVWWKANAVPNLAALDPRLNLSSQLTSQCFSIPNVPVAQDTSAHTHALAIEAALGGPDHMAARVGTCAQSSLIAAQLLRVREAWPDVWTRTGRVQVASAFLCSLMCGSWVGMNEPEACATGMWVHGTNSSPGHWDEGVLEIIGGNREEGRRIRTWLGDVDLSGGSRKIGMISRYLVDRYRFDHDTIVTPFALDTLSSYLSLIPQPTDAVLQLGPMDYLMGSAANYAPSRLFNLYPHPAQDPSEKRKYIVALTSRNADVPRALVRDMYTKSWSAFDRLVDIVPPGGSIGLDDKLFSFWFLQADGFPFSHVKGIFRFETGIKVNEFRDLRANPRCLLESQFLSFRVRWSRILTSGIFGNTVGRGGAVPNSNAPPPSKLGLAFDPYDHSTLPSRIIATGAAANFPSVVNIIGDIFNTPVIIPTSQIDGAQVTPHRNAPAKGHPSRAGMGGAYVARWVWGRERGGIRAGGTFEDDLRKVFSKRWMMTGGLVLKTSVNATPQHNNSAISTPAVGGHPTGGNSRGGSGSSTPYSHHPRSGLGTTVVVEEDEEEIDIDVAAGRLRSLTTSAITGPLQTTSASLSLLSNSALAASALNGQNPVSFIGPELLSPDLSNTAGGETSATTSAPLTPVTVMTSTSESDLQVGLGKVTDPDVDSFMGYAAIVPEYCRLEGMLVKGIV